MRELLVSRRGEAAASAACTGPLDILRALGQQPMGVQEPARAVGREKSQVSPALKALAQEGFTERDPSSLRYRTGPQWPAPAASAGERRLHREAPPVLRELVHRVGEPAYLTVLSGHSVVTVLTERTSRALQAHEWTGRTSPVNRTSAGRALPFDPPDEEVAALLATEGDALMPGTDAAPREVAAVLERLRREREHGHAVAIEEMQPGLIAVAAPVHDHRGRVVAAMNVSAPVFRLPPQAVPRMAEMVVAAAHRLSARLAGAEPPVR